MRIHHTISLIAALAMSAGALTAQGQDATTKPSGLTKVAHEVSSASRTTGRAVKADVKSVGSATHQTLRKAGNNTKAELKRTTGLTSKTPTPGHPATGINKVARSVSHASKTAGSTVKKDVKAVGSAGHSTAKKAGNDVKTTAKKVVKPGTSAR